MVDGICHPYPMKDTGRGPTVFRDGLRSGATGNWVRWAVERGGGRRRGKGRTHVSLHLCPLSTHSSLPCLTFRLSVGKEERESHRGEETALKSSERKEKSQYHRRRKGF